jgi:hypothetical protein
MAVRHSWFIPILYVKHYISGEYGTMMETLLRGIGCGYLLFQIGLIESQKKLPTNALFSHEFSNIVCNPSGEVGHVFA